MNDAHHQLFSNALSAYDRKDYINCGAACEDILRANDSNADALYLIGLCHCHDGSPEVGIKFIKRALALKPEFEDYDLLREVMIHQGITKHADLWEARFLQYLLFQDVDAFLVSYPKCGRTWLRLLLGKYVLGENETLSDPLEILRLTQARADFSTLEFSHDDYAHWKRPDQIFANKQSYADKKVIFLTRDPRDVLVSYFFQYTKRGDKDLANDAGFEGSLSDFIDHDIGGLRSLVAFYNVWAENRGVPDDFLLITYEDMHKDIGEVLGQVIRFLDWPPRENGFVEDIVESVQFGEMRKLEESNALNSPRLAPPADGDTEGFKVRKGKVGGYTDYFSEDDIRRIDEYLLRNLDDFYSIYKGASG